MRSSYRLPSFVCLLFTLCLTAVASLARAQAGPFVDAQPPWFGPFGSSGVTTNAGGDSLLVDTNGNGFIDGADLRYPRPAAIAGSLDLRLSPARGVLYAVTNSSGTTNVWFYRLPLVSGAAPVLLSGPVAIAGGVASYGFCDRPGDAARRIAYVSETTPAGGAQQVHWFDLEAGTHAFTSAPFTASVGFVKFAPSGIEAFVQSGLGGPGGTSDYSLVSTCAASLGRVDNPGGAGLHGLSGVPVAAIVTGGGGTQAQITCACLPLPVTVTLDDCTAPVLLGACCLPGGGCIDGTTAAEAAALGGTWMGAGSTCATAGCPQPPSPHLYVSARTTGPAVQNQLLTYVFEFGNSGTAASAGVTLRDNLPSGVTFVRVSGNGVYSSFSGAITWAAGTLAAGATRAESLIVRPSCSASTITNNSYSLTGTPGGFVSGPGVVTPVAGHSAAPLTLTLGAVASQPAPLHANATITYSLQITNSAPVARTALTFSTMFGPQSTLDAVIDAAGGSVTSTASQLTWTGDVSAGGSITVVFRTRITACRSLSVTQERLNNGAAISVRNGCGATVGALTPADVFELAPPTVTAELWHTNTALPGGAQHSTLARPGSTLELDLRVHNHEAPSQPAVSAHVTLPAGFEPASEPPFIGGTPPGAAWDALSRTLSWSGALAGGQSVHVPFRVNFDSSACRLTLTAGGSYGACTNGLTATLQVHPVAAPPAGDHLLLLDAGSGVRVMDAASGAMRWLLCTSAELFTGFDASANGNIWVAGLPALRFNPYTLDFEFFHDLADASLQPPFASGAGLLLDVKYVPETHQVDWLANAPPTGSGLLLRRWDPASGALATLMGGGVAPQTWTGRQMVRDAQGRIVLDAVGGVLRLDPQQPGTSETLTDPAFTRASAVTLDHDGAYLVCEYTFGTGTKRTLARIDPVTGAFTEIVHDLNSIVPSSRPFYGIAAAPNGDIYLASDAGLLAIVHRGATVTGETRFIGGSIAALRFVTGANVGVGDEPGPPPAIATLALAPVTPNPCTGRASVHFRLAAAGRARVTVHDLLGRRVALLADAAFAAGEHAAEWTGMDDRGVAQPSGMYFVRLEAGGRVLLRKVILER